MRPLAPALAFALALPACSDAGGTASAPLVRDSAGIQIVENTAPVWGEGEAWRLADTASVDIGTVAGDPAYQLFEVAGAIRLSDGRIVIANSGTHELRFYDAAGDHLQSVGREGEGPGEFTDMQWMGRLAGDSIAVWDGNQKRLSIFGPGGVFARSFNPDGLAGIYPELTGTLGNGAFIFTSGFMGAPRDDSGEIHRDSITYLRYDRKGSLVDTLGTFPGGESYLLSGDWGTSDSHIIFGRIGEIAFNDEGFWFGDSEAYEIVEYSLDPEVIKVIRKEHEPVRVQDNDLARYHELNSESDLSSMPAQMRELFEQKELAEREELPHRSTLPAFKNLVAGQNGSLWVERSRLPGDDQPMWDVFDPNGRWLGAVATPVGLGVLEIGPDWLLGSWQDEMEVEHVSVYDLKRP